MRLPTHSIRKKDVDPLHILFYEKTRNDGTYFHPPVDAALAVNELSLF
jgi:hypothetical protein